MAHKLHMHKYNQTVYKKERKKEGNEKKEKERQKE